MILYIRTPDDDPHLLAESNRGIARCGVSLAHALKVSEAQALKFLHGRRCYQCDPHYRHPHANRHVNKAA